MRYTKPNAELPLPPSQALMEARVKLRDIFIENFQVASRNKDSATASRFFKLFPPIGWREEGLSVYSSFVIELLQTRPPPSINRKKPLHAFLAPAY